MEKSGALQLAETGGRGDNNDDNEQQQFVAEQVTTLT
jgi:hypothetical protein